MDAIEDHLAVRERCKALLSEQGWRQIALVAEAPGELSLAFQRQPSVTGMTPEIVIVQIADRASNKLLRARAEIQSDLHAFGVITILTDPAAEPFSQDLRCDELIGEEGSSRLLAVLEQLDSVAASRGWLPRT